MALSNGLDQGQESTRRPATIYDQHVCPEFPRGRPWHADVEKKTGFPAGLVRPKGWNAPWLPDQTTFKYNPDEPNHFTIPYEEILSSGLEAHAEYQTMKEQAAIARGWDPKSEEKQAVLEALVGNPPLPVEPIVAAMQGNRYMLGMTKKVDPRLEQFVRQETRKEKLLKGLPDFSETTAIETQGIEADAEPVSWDDELDNLLNIEEEADPSATGGKRVNPKKTTKV